MKSTTWKKIPGGFFISKKGHSKYRAKVMWASGDGEAGVAGEKWLYYGKKYGENRKISHAGRGKGKIGGNVAACGRCVVQKRWKGVSYV